jgi:hypothetical protein
MLRIVLVLFLATLAFAPMAVAQTKKPPLPPGRDPGGIAIALLTTGIDYTSASVARGLARDGEGELIGFDLVDGDNRPFGDNRAQTRPHWGGEGTTLAINILDPTIGARLVPVRVDPRDPTSLARAVAFIARTPARIVAVPMWGPHKEDWQPFRQAVEHLPRLLFLVAAGDDGKDLDKAPVYPAAFALPNVLVVTAASTVADRVPRTQVLATANWGGNTVDAVALAGNSALATAVAARAAVAIASRSPGLNGAEFKLRLIQDSLSRREGETPQRTRSLAVVVPMMVRVHPTPDPSARILDKARVPELLQQPDRGDGRPRDGKAR